MTQIIQRVERTQIETVYSDIRLLTDDIASCYKFLLTKLYDAGCRYVQFDGVHSVIMEDTIRLNNRVCVSVLQGCMLHSMHRRTCWCNCMGPMLIS